MLCESGRDVAMKVSVIVPVYNAESYLEECLESLVNQTLPAEEMEILAVDDCSTDGSRTLLERYAQMYAQIHVLYTKKNSGPGGARNVGLDAAGGEYIGFVDSDDAAVPTMFEQMYDVACAGDFDIVDAGVYYQGKDLAMVHTGDADTGQQTDEKRSHNIVSGGYLMTRIFRRAFWEKSGLRFREHVILEDMESLMYLYATAERIGNLKEICYVYRNTGGSASKEADYEKYQKHAVRAMRATYERMSALPGYDGIRDAVEYALVQLYSYALNQCLVQKGRRSDEELLQHLKQLAGLRKKYVRPGYENLYVKNKIAEADIQIMKWNDASPGQLLALIEPQ